MTCGLVHASYSLPEWQAVKLTFFAPCLLFEKFCLMTCYYFSLQWVFLWLFLGEFLAKTRLEASMHHAEQRTFLEKSHQYHGKNFNALFHICSKDQIVVHLYMGKLAAPQPGLKSLGYNLFGICIFTGFSLSFKVDSWDVKEGGLVIECCRQFQAFPLSLYSFSPKSRRLNSM